MGGGGRAGARGRCSGAIRIAAAVAALVAMAPLARGQEIAPREALSNRAFAPTGGRLSLSAPRIPKSISLGDKLEAKATLWSNVAARHLSALSFDLVKLHFDVRHQRARFRLGGGHDGKLALHIAGHVVMHGSTARVAARIAFGVAGHRYAVNLPEVDLVPRSEAGNRYVELLVPLVRRSF